MRRCGSHVARRSLLCALLVLTACSEDDVGAPTEVTSTRHRSEASGVTSTTLSSTTVPTVAPPSPVTTDETDATRSASLQSASHEDDPDPGVVPRVDTPIIQTLRISGAGGSPGPAQLNRLRGDPCEPVVRTALVVANISSGSPVVATAEWHGGPEPGTATLVEVSPGRFDLTLGPFHELGTYELVVTATNAAGGSARRSSPFGVRDAPSDAPMQCEVGEPPHTSTTAVTTASAS